MGCERRRRERWLLCDFLDVPVPAEEFPHVNTSESFRDRIAEMRKSLQTES